MTKLLTIVTLMGGLLLLSCNGESKKQRGSNKINLLTKSEKEQGYALYRSKCMNCHMPNGEGIKGVYPPLAKSDFLRKNPTKSLAMVKYGSNMSIKVNGVRYEGVMPSAGISDEQLVLLFNYIMNSWGNSLGRVTIEDVREVTKPR